MSLVSVLLESRRPRRGVQEEERGNVAGSPHLQSELPVVAPGLPRRPRRVDTEMRLNGQLPELTCAVCNGGSGLAHGVGGVARLTRTQLPPPIRRAVTLDRGVDFGPVSRSPRCGCPRSGMRDFFCRNPNQLGDPFSIFKSVFNKKVLFGSRIRWGLNDIPYVDSPLFGWLHEQLTVAHERNHFVVTIDGVPTKHLA